jgi:DNA processing protein
VSDSADLDRAVLVALLRARPRGLTWSQLVAEVVQRGSPRIAWDALRERSLFDTDDGEIPPLVAEAVRDIHGWMSAGLGFHTFLDHDFPAQLREIHQMPPVLFSRGTLLADDHAVSVVGSRRASEPPSRAPSPVI